MNNGHTVQVSYAPGSTLTVAGEVYELLQFHFHAPSEHVIAGSRAPMEAHFVHRNAAGALAVVGVMMQAGRHNDPLASVFANIPAEAGPEVANRRYGGRRVGHAAAGFRRLLPLQGLAHDAALQRGSALVRARERDRGERGADRYVRRDLRTQRETAAETERPSADHVSVMSRMTALVAAARRDAKRHARSGRNGSFPVTLDRRPRSPSRSDAGRPLRPRPHASRTVQRFLTVCLLLVFPNVCMAPIFGAAAGSEPTNDRYCEFTPAAKTDRLVPGLIVGADVLLPEGRRPNHAVHIRFNGVIGAVARFDALRAALS